MHLLSQNTEPRYHEPQRLLNALRSALKLLEGETDAAMREALRVQMMEFGRTPRRLFRYPHPPRRAAVTGARSPPPLCGCLRVAQSPAPAPRAANPSQPEVVDTVWVTSWMECTRCDACEYMR